MTDNDALVRKLEAAILGADSADHLRDKGLWDTARLVETAAEVLAALRSTPQAKSLDPPAQDEVEVLAATIFEADPDVGTTWDEWVAYANEHPDHLQSVEYVRRLATAAIAALDRHPAGDDALREENARLRGALRDASVSLWWAARQMKGNCNGGAVDAVNLAAEDASSVAALTGRQG